MEELRENSTGFCRTLVKRRPSSWRQVLCYIAILGSLTVCLALLVLSVCAWSIHFWWLQTGAYSQNSLPMNILAWGLTRLAVATTLILGVGLGLAWFVSIRTAAKTSCFD